jgi:hypothetical protein
MMALTTVSLSLYDFPARARILALNNTKVTENTADNNNVAASCSGVMMRLPQL